VVDRSVAMKHATRLPLRPSGRSPSPSARLGVLTSFAPWLVVAHVWEGTEL
jgi:hypothetical protein